MKRILSTLLHVLILGSPYCTAQSYDAISHMLDSLVIKKILPSVTVAISKGGKMVYAEAFGYADVEKKTLANIHTPYTLASLSKPITTTAIMHMHESGLIDIDKPVTKYIPYAIKKASPEFNTPTIRQVMNHTAGLGTYFSLYYEDEPLAAPSFAQEWANYGTVFEAPGKVSEYSNLGYGLLSEIVTHNSAMPFAQYLSEAVIQPLGLKNTWVIQKGKYKAMAKPYTRNLLPLPYIHNTTVGAGNIAASAYDLIQFANVHLQNLEPSVLRAASIQEMQKRKPAQALFHYYEKTHYGLGWYIRPDDGGHPVVWHEGGMMGTSTMLKLYPKDNLAIVLLTNTYNSAVCRKVVDKIAAISIRDYTPTPLVETAEYLPVTLDTTLSGTWEGLMTVGSRRIPIQLKFERGQVFMQYLDHTLAGYHTKGQPISHTIQWAFGATNQQRLIGTGFGKLPGEHFRNELSHFLTFKLFKEAQKITGTVAYMAAGKREYYAYPYAIHLEKAKVSNKASE